MKRVDHMIKYLSGDLSSEESRALEEELSRDRELAEVFEEVSAAYRLTGDQLRKRDEDLFRTRLREVMDRSNSKSKTGSGKRGPRWLLLLPLAASAAILLTILFLQNNPDQIYKAFFYPMEDPVILAFSTETRGNYESAALLFAKAEYQSVLELTFSQLTDDPTNQAALLFHLLAALELDLEADALAKLEEAELDTSQAIGQALTWYRTLALLKAGQKAEAEIILSTLLESPGSYATAAHKLQKMLTK